MVYETALIFEHVYTVGDPRVEGLHEEHERGAFMEAHLCEEGREISMEEA